MDLQPYKTFPVWDKHSLPEAFTKAHCTQEWTWAQLTIIKGWVAFEFLDDAHEAEARHVLDIQNQLPPLPPQRWHRIAEVSDDAQLQLQFLCMPEDYFNKKHGLTRTHSEVVGSRTNLGRRLRQRAQYAVSGQAGLYRGRLGHQSVASG